MLALLLAGHAAAADYALPPPPPTPARGSRVDYWADRAEFSESSSTLHLSGNVTLKMSTVTVKGQDIWIDNARGAGRTDKPFFIEDGLSAVYGKSGEFDFNKRTSLLFATTTGSGDWRIRARKAQLSEDRRVRYWAPTSLLDQVPRLSLSRHSIRVVPKNFFSPGTRCFSARSRFSTPRSFQVFKPQPYAEVEAAARRPPGGPYVRHVDDPATDTVYTKIFDDYYSNQGYGYGAEVGRNSGVDSRGSVFGYKIHEDGTVKNRWGYFGGGYQNLISSTSFQGRLQFQSDPLFPSDYIRSDIFRLTPELINSAALTRTFSKATVRVIYARQDVWDPSNSSKFVKNIESRPRYEVQGNSFSAGEDALAQYAQRLCRRQLHARTPL